MIHFNSDKFYQKGVCHHFSFDGDPSKFVDEIRRIESDRQCNLGKWIYGEGYKHHALPPYSTLLKQHAQYHRVAAEINHALHAGEYVRAKQLLSGKLRSLSAAVISAVEMLMDQVNADLSQMPGIAKEPGEFRKRFELPETLCIGDATIDEQHAELIDLIDRLGSIPALSLSSECFADRFLALDLYLRFHTDTEEIMMWLSDMPQEEIDSHFDDHNRLLADIAQIYFDAMDHRQASVDTICQAIKAATLDHILQYDLDMAPYISTV